VAVVPVAGGEPGAGKRREVEAEQVEAAVVGTVGGEVEPVRPEGQVALGVGVVGELAGGPPLGGDDVDVLLARVGEADEGELAPVWREGQVGEGHERLAGRVPEREAPAHAEVDRGGLELAGLAGLARRPPGGLEAVGL